MTPEVRESKKQRKKKRGITEKATVRQASQVRVLTSRAILVIKRRHFREQGNRLRIYTGDRAEGRLLVENYVGSVPSSRWEVRIGHLKTFGRTGRVVTGGLFGANTLGGRVGRHKGKTYLKTQTKTEKKSL